MKVFGDTKQIKKSVNTQTQNMNMIVDEKAFSILIDKLYSNKKYAIMREIASNAVDAHLAAGIDKPFDVTLPTMTSKELIIRDYGDGLSYDDCYYYLGTIFGSKSQNADNLIGGFGLGSKSPFCLVSSYHITSRHEGLEHKFLYLREQNGIPQFIHVYSEPTDEPSGIEFVIDVGSDTRGWVDVAIRNLSFFDIKPNFTNQKDIKLIEPLYLTDYLMYVDGYNYLFSDDYMVSMGGVVYDIPEYEYKNKIRDAIRHCKIKSMYNSTFILDFEIGELDISPSREHIEMTDKTKKSIERKSSEIRNSGLAEKVKKVFVDNIAEHGYNKGYNLGIARFYGGAYTPEIFTDADIAEYPAIADVINQVKSMGVYDTFSKLGITSFKEHKIFKSYTTNYGNNGYRSVSVQSCHKRAIVNDIRMSRMVIDNQIDDPILVVKPKADTIQESKFILEKALSFLYKDDYVVELASEMNLQRPKRSSSSMGVDSSGFITGIRTVGKNKVYDKDIDESVNEYIYIETDGSYNKLINTESNIMDIMIQRDSLYDDILPVNDGGQYKRVLLVTTATISKMQLVEKDNWHSYEDVAKNILSSEPYIKSIVKQAVFSINKGYGIYRSAKIIVDAETLPLFKKYAIEFNHDIINKTQTTDDGDSILLSDVIRGFDDCFDNPVGITNIIFNKKLTISKKEVLSTVSDIISCMDEKKMLYYMDGNYSLYGV